MDIILEKIGQLAVFLICAQTLMHFRAAESYEKYIKLWISLMLLILLLRPLTALCSTERVGDLAGKIRLYEKQLQTSAFSPIGSEAQMQEMIDRITEKRIREGMETEEQEQKEADKEHSLAETKNLRTQIETISVETIQLGGQHGKTAANP